MILFSGFAVIYAVAFFCDDPVGYNKQTLTLLITRNAVLDRISFIQRRCLNKGTGSVYDPVFGICCHLCSDVILERENWLPNAPFVDSRMCYSLEVSFERRFMNEGRGGVYDSVFGICCQLCRFIFNFHF